MKTTASESKPAMGLLTQQTVCFSHNTLAKKETNETLNGCNCKKQNNFGTL